MVACGLILVGALRTDPPLRRHSAGGDGGGRARHRNLHRRSGLFRTQRVHLLGVLYIGKLLTYFIAIRALHDARWWIAWRSPVAFTDIFAMLVGTAIAVIS